MNYYKIKYEDGREVIDSAESSLEIVKRYDLATRANISTRIIQLEGEQLAIAISNDQEDEDGQFYTDCDNCGAFGIPIIDDGAPELCINCEPTEEDKQWHRNRELVLSAAERATAIQEVK